VVVIAPHLAGLPALPLAAASPCTHSHPLLHCDIINYSYTLSDLKKV
jgi:hypothetical protein